MTVQPSSQDMLKLNPTRTGAEVQQQEQQSFSKMPALDQFSMSAAAPGLSSILLAALLSSLVVALIVRAHRLRRYNRLMRLRTCCRPDRLARTLVSPGAAAITNAVAKASVPNLEAAPADSVIIDCEKIASNSQQKSVDTHACVNSAKDAPCSLQPLPRAPSISNLKRNLSSSAVSESSSVGSASRRISWATPLVVMYKSEGGVLEGEELKMYLEVRRAVPPPRPYPKSRSRGPSVRAAARQRITDAESASSQTSAAQGNPDEQPSETARSFVDSVMSTLPAGDASPRHMKHMKHARLCPTLTYAWMQLD
mmetsp:Transcript_40800/g.89549  ORF Transcript_40800/g.89549 Transcript_40800/m.89549 type:complete len:310 (+) Transcript_40800:460-1389(+)